MQDHGDLVGVGDDVVVRYNVTRRVDDKARTQGSSLPGLSLGATAFGHPVVEKVAKELLERRAWRKLRNLRPGMLMAAAVGFERLCCRNVDHRRKQSCRKVSKAIRCGSGSGGPGCKDRG